MGGGEAPYKVPDYRIYTTEGIKELEWTRKMLAARGLKDPWERNEVWRYRSWPGFRANITQLLTRGLKWAVPAIVLTIAIDKITGFSKKRERHHHGSEYWHRGEGGHH